MAFGSLELPPAILKAVEALGYTTPTPIQEQAIPVVRAGRDIAAEAQTGSGKTAAFGIPVMERLAALSHAGWYPRVLILEPTRELALQVASVLKDLARFARRDVRVVAVIGGETIEQQVLALHRGADVVVATPGRLIDLYNTADLELADIDTLVLDEADKLLGLGFREELDAVFASLPAKRQTLLFSATLAPKVVALAETVLTDPVEVRIHAEQTPVETIHQRVFQVDRNRRRALLQHLATEEDWGQTLVFVATQRATENLSAKLRKAGFGAQALHGGLVQVERNRVLEGFKQGRIGILVATDIAARGIDVPELAAVVNFDLPRSPKDYVHRIGRTGRAGAEGLAVSFVDHDTESHFRVIEKKSGGRLERLVVEGFELGEPAPVRTKGPAPVKGKRKSKKDKLREAAARAAAENDGGS